MKPQSKPNVSGQWVDRLKRLMEETGLSTTQDLANKSGVSAGSLSQALRGMHVPKQVTLEKIAVALDTTPQYLLFGETRNVENMIPVIRQREQLLRFLSNDVVDTQSLDWFDAGGLEGVNANWFALDFTHTDMRPAFVPGDLVLFNRVDAGDFGWKTLALDRDVYVMAIRISLDQQNVVFGRLARTGDGHFVESMDNHYPPVFIEDEYQIIGIAVHQIRRLT